MLKSLKPHDKRGVAVYVCLLIEQFLKKPKQNSRISIWGKIIA